MVVDRRSVHTDALETLGSIIGAGEARDAIHLAVEPVVAAVSLYPGQHVGLLPDGKASTKAGKMLGIVDPFLKDGVKAGERFWLVVYPRQITSLRHVWSHPDFAATPELPTPTVGSDEAWLRAYADEIDVGFRDLIESAEEWVRTHDGRWGGEYMVRGGTLEGVSTRPEFWDRFVAYTGIDVPETARGNFFSCSC